MLFNATFPSLISFSLKIKKKIILQSLGVYQPGRLRVQPGNPLEGKVLGIQNTYKANKKADYGYK
jgi:hypothetical protein